MESGDCAVVNLQSSMGSSRSEVLFVANLAVIPVPWWEWQGFGSLPIRSAKEYHGLWRERLHPESDNWWVVQLLDNRGISTLRRLLNRDALVETIRAGNLGVRQGSCYAAPF